MEKIIRVSAVLALPERVLVQIDELRDAWGLQSRTAVIERLLIGVLSVEE